MRGAPNRGRARRARQRPQAILDAVMRVTAPAQIREPEDLAFLSAAALDEERLEIDLTDVEWISPLGVVAVLTTCLRADEASLHATVELPENRAARTYLAQIGLVAELARCDWRVPDNIDIDPNADIGPHLPVSRLTTEREVVAASYQLDDALHKASLAGGLFDDLNRCRRGVGGECPRARLELLHRRPDSHRAEERHSWVSPRRRRLRSGLRADSSRDLR